MTKDREEAFQKAKNYAFLLLKFRQRSYAELSQRLKRKKFDPEAIRKALGFLREKGFIDDVLFAKSWVSSRLKRSYGLRKIKQELVLKGVDKEVSAEALAEHKDSYNEEDTIREIIRQKISKLKAIDPQSARRRIYGYLVRRGFSPEAVAQNLNQLCRHKS